MPLERATGGVAVAGAVGALVQTMPPSAGAGGVLGAPQSRLIALDLSEPAAPRQTGTWTLAGAIAGVALDGKYAYVVSGPGIPTLLGSGLLHIVDLGDPTRPTEIGRVAIPGAGLAVAVRGGQAVVAHGGSGTRNSGVSVVDVSQPTEPRRLGTYGWLSRAEPVGVALLGSTALVADSGEGLRVIDLSEPARPSEVGLYRAGGGARGVAVAKNVAYVIDTPAPRAPALTLRVVAVVDPSHPGVIGSVDIPVTAFGDPNAGIGLGASAGRIYVAAGPGGLHVVDASDPTHPVEVGGQIGGDSVQTVAVERGFVYAGGPAGLAVFKE